MSEYQHPLSLPEPKTPEPDLVESGIDWQIASKALPYIITIILLVAWIAFALIPMLTGAHSNSFSLVDNLQFALLALCLLYGAFHAATHSRYLFSTWCALLYLTTLLWF